MMRPGATSAVGLVMAKAPVPGQVKTRLAQAVGDATAARLAAAALLDTLDVCERVFPQGQRVLALSGSLDQAVGSDDIIAALDRWRVIWQRGPDLAHRIAAAHREVHRLVGGPVVQVGMDTPHMSPKLLAAVARCVERRRQPVLGLADDGGWWVLATATPSVVDRLPDVAMSRSDTGIATHRAIRLTGRIPVIAPRLGDIDTADDAALAASRAPHTRFAQAWRAHLFPHLASTP